MRPRQTMMMTFPADSTRIASTWSPLVSTCSTGVTIVRNDGIVTVRYTAIPNTYVATNPCQSNNNRRRTKTQAHLDSFHQRTLHSHPSCEALRPIQSTQHQPIRGGAPTSSQYSSKPRVVRLKQRAHLYSWRRIEKCRVELKPVTNHVLC